MRRLPLLLLIVALLAAVTAAFGDPAAPTSGMAPLPNDAKVPASVLPPGSFDPDTGPSDVIFPAQTMSLRFNHKLHMSGQGMKCVDCHAGAPSSDSATDDLIPKPEKCDGCHGSKHTDLNAVRGDDGNPMATCSTCHVGWKAGDANKVVAFRMPRPNLVFSHRRHAVRNIACGQCHGDVAALELATRDQLPRMRGCFHCHQGSDAARGDAKAACETCHLTPGPDLRGGSGVTSNIGTGFSESGRIRSLYPQGALLPPRWMHDAEHGPDFIERHKTAAGNDSEFCKSCHQEDFCTNCHDGRTRPRSIHPNDYLNMHPVEARLATQKCQSCHREQSFCTTCHMRIGVAESGPTAFKEPGRFHPPKAIWTDGARTMGHHAVEAQRNLSACVRCHIERDCVQCHGGAGVGAGINVHPPSFQSSCAMQLRRNPRPCLVCHELDDKVFAQCR
ncbi:hypothetical protein BH09MYX1_BH09MYX1_55500 [soil metagenome]